MRKTKKKLKKTSRSGLKSRLILVSVLFVLYGLGLTARLFYLQILHHEELMAQSEKQYAQTVKVHYGRGAVFDRNLNELASNIEVESIYANPPEVPDRRQTARKLASALNLDRDTVYKKLTSKKHFVWIKRKSTLEESRKIRRLHLPGVKFMPEQKRFYPKRELAAGVLGFVGMDNQGLAGIEHYHQSLLKGTTVRQLIQKDARGRYIRSSYDLASSKYQSHDVVLTIDEVIQFITEHHLAIQVKKYNAKAGMALVMDPFTGEILAMANVPTFNPNNYASYPARRWSNLLVASSFEPGSIFKPILAAAALDSGRVHPKDIFFCENGKFRVGRVNIGEAENHKFGWLNLRNIVTKSSNIGAIKIAYQLGEQNFYDYIKRFGFGEKAGIDLPGESPGQLRNISRWSGLSLASLSFGHEIAVTPVQMVAAIAAVANGGKLMRPRITKAILRNGKPIKQFKPETVRRVISEKTSRQMIEILTNVVKNGTGKQAALQGFDAAGKTGTAQKFDSRTQRYSNTEYLSSFIGFAPADNPKLVILVMIDQPRGNYWGGVVAAPVFRKISQQVLRYLNVPSSEERVYIMDRA